MPVANFKKLQEKLLLNHQKDGKKKSNGSDFPVSQTKKKLQAQICLLLVELCERFTFFAIVCNMIIFCTVKLGYHNYQAVILNLSFIGTSMLTPVFVGWLADTCLERTRLAYICSFLHFVGTAMLPVVAFPSEDFYVDSHYMIHSLPKKEQNILFYLGLMATCLGTGGIRTIVCPLSSYRLQEHGPKKLMSFFTWYNWLMNLNAVIAFLGICYVQQSVARNFVFLIPFMSMLMALITVHMVHSELIYQPEKGGSLLTIWGVFFNALKMCCLKYNHLGPNVPSWLDRAKENNGGWYSELQVEHTKSFFRLFPLFVFQLLYRVCIMQIPSGYYLQTMNSNLNLNGFLLPIAAMNVISIIPLLILAPFLQCISTCIFPLKRGGPPLSICIIAGNLSAALSVMGAGFFEIQRKNFPLVEQILSGKILPVSAMPCLQLAPQYILLGVAEALVNPACSAISYKLIPSKVRGISMNFLALFNGFGCFVGALMVKVVYTTSEGNWFPNALNKGNLENTFFFLASLMLLNILGFWSISHRYCNLNQFDNQRIRRHHPEETLLQNDQYLKYYDSIMEFSSTIDPYETAL
ncbi:solute carrier family 15 member 5 [Vombatus ursinus]|uniref:Solute carrier family 15 member 5 n=1 Tax=Vombatus ursinus TaxID=29139 RepID=A0A4X2LC61_VOMUR|nr:solute carrier family 15 member 5 [Vombatus ursinus]